MAPTPGQRKSRCNHGRYTMQAQIVQLIINEIDAHIKQSGITNPNWYVGVTSDIDERLACPGIC